MELATQPGPTRSTSRKGPDRKSNCFDAIRLFAAVSVMVWHAVRHTLVPFLWLRPGGEGWFFDGVPLFFILSGMLVYQSCYRCLDERRPVRQFYLNRFLRVGPALYVYATLTPLFLLAVGVIGYRIFLSQPFAVYYVSNLLFCPVRDTMFQPFAAPLDGSLWTIPVEVSFYVFCPVLVLVERKFGLRMLIGALLAFAVAGLVLQWHFEGNPAVPAVWWRAEVPPQATHLASRLALRLILSTFLSFLPFFILFGLGIFWLRMWPRVSHSGWFALVCLVGYVLVRYLGSAAIAHLGPFADAAWALPLSYLAVWVGYSAPKWVSKITSIGDLSYGLYIWHMVVVEAVIYYAIPLQAAPVVVHLLIYAASFIIAFASWKLVEKPALKLKPFTARDQETIAW